MNTEEQKIPEKHIDFCREMGALARKAGLNRVTIVIQPNCLDPFHNDIKATWEAGRHNEDAGQIYIESTIRIHEKIP